ncbi:MAG TPA: type II secretion system protein GspE, partial [Rubellimicrobium sp.]|nr:type II secretion system protein GspE [Rubellimicrobium sp.]
MSGDLTRLSYAFAKAQGVVLWDGDGGRVVCRHRPDAAVEALLEAQRVHGAALAFEETTPSGFEEALGRAYRDSATEAAASAAD